jgi:hypothetical protein
MCFLKKIDDIQYVCIVAKNSNNKHRYVISSMLFTVHCYVRGIL